MKILLKQVLDNASNMLFYQLTKILPEDIWGYTGKYIYICSTDYSINVIYVFCNIPQVGVTPM